MWFYNGMLGHHDKCDSWIMRRGLLHMLAFIATEGTASTYFIFVMCYTICWQIKSMYLTEQN